MAKSFSPLRERRRSRGSEDRGAAAVEFALVLPLLVTFLVGVVTYGYIMAFQQSVTEAAGAGARSAAIAPIEKTLAQRTTSAKATIDQVMSNYDLKCGEDGLTCTVTVAPCSGDATRNCATVLVSYNWKANPRVPSLPLLPAPDKIEHKSVIEVS